MSQHALALQASQTVRHGANDERHRPTPVSDFYRFAGRYAPKDGAGLAAKLADTDSRRPARPHHLRRCLRGRGTVTKSRTRHDGRRALERRLGSAPEGDRVAGRGLRACSRSSRQRHRRIAPTARRSTVSDRGGPPSRDRQTTGALPAKTRVPPSLRSRAMIWASNGSGAATGGSSPLRCFTRGAGHRTEHGPSLRWFTRGAGHRTEHGLRSAGSPVGRVIGRSMALRSAGSPVGRVIGRSMALAPLVHPWGGSSDGAWFAPLVHPWGGSSDGAWPVAPLVHPWGGSRWHRGTRCAHHGAGSPSDPHVRLSRRQACGHDRPQVLRRDQFNRRPMSTPPGRRCNSTNPRCA